MVSAEICGFCLQNLSQWKPEEENDLEEKLKIEHLDVWLPPSLKETISTARNEFLKAAEDVSMEYHVFSDFGKKRIKEMGFHPDAFVQVLLQAAIFKTHNRGLATYETATTRQFYHGRTETVRSCTNEALAFAKALSNPNCEESELRDLLKTAVNKHLQLMERCKTAQGCDRLLFGLKIEALKNSKHLPELFNDPSYKIRLVMTKKKVCVHKKKLFLFASGGDGNFGVSTSLCGYGPITGACVPMTKDGYGVFYGIPNNQ